MNAGSRWPSGLSIFGTVAVLLSALVLAADVPASHHHDTRGTALYDQECPAMRLATSAGSIGLGPRPMTDLGPAPPAPEAVPSRPLRAVLGTVLLPPDARAPPLST